MCSHGKICIGLDSSRIDMSPGIFSKQAQRRRLNQVESLFQGYLIRDANAVAGIIESAYFLCREHDAIRLVAVGGDAR